MLYLGQEFCHAPRLLIVLNSKGGLLDRDARSVLRAGLA